MALQCFWFSKTPCVPDTNKKITHAELTHGSVMIIIVFLNSGTEFAKLIKHLNDIGGFETQSPYIVLNEIHINKHDRKAKEYGAKIIIELKEEDYGGKNYSFYDLQGYLWNFGTYNPWKTKY